MRLCGHNACTFIELQILPTCEVQSAAQKLLCDAGDGGVCVLLAIRRARRARLHACCTCSCSICPRCRCSVERASAPGRAQHSCRLRQPRADAARSSSSSPTRPPACTAYGAPRTAVGTAMRHYRIPLRLRREGWGAGWVIAMCFRATAKIVTLAAEPAGWGKGHVQNPGINTPEVPAGTGGATVQAGTACKGAGRYRPGTHVCMCVLHMLRLHPHL